MEDKINKRIAWIEQRVELPELAKEYIAFQMMQFAKYYHKQQIKAGDLADVGGSYSRKDMSDAWSAGYHRRADEDNGNQVTSFTDWIETHNAEK